MVGTSIRMKLVLVFILCALMVMCLPSFLQPKISYGLGSGVKDGVYQSSEKAIDLYTQKEPYSGRGPNQPSDAFAPQEEVILYANVTYMGGPVANKLVAFEVHDPSLSSRLTRTAETDGSGLANVSFRIPWPIENAETIVFGTWSVLANVEIAEEVVTDTLTFKVCWIVEILKVETVDVNNLSKTSFMKGQHIHFRLTVNNTARVEKVATLTFDVYDESEVPLGVVIREDVKIPPGVTVYFIKDLLIPTWAFVGVGVVSANAYTASHAPWCPQVSTTFLITKLYVPPVVWELPAWLMWLLIILTILVAASMVTSIALLFYVRKKKENSPAKVAAPVTCEGKNYKTCVKCGREFLGVRTFCPYCFTYNG